MPKVTNRPPKSCNTTNSFLFVLFVAFVVKYLVAANGCSKSIHG